MAIKFRKNALKFLETADSEIKEKIREQLKQVMICVENQGFIPFNELDIKKYFFAGNHQCTKLT